MDLSLKNIDLELRTFLALPQQGARQVARKLFEQVSRARSGQFGAAVAGDVEIDLDPVFDNLPADRGHFEQPYWPFVLRGLRTRAPRYVLDVEEGHAAPLWLTSQVAGMMIVRF